MAKTRKLTDLHDLARLGAAVRLKQIDEEAAAIRQMFQGTRKAREAGVESARAAPTAKAAAAPQPRKRKMSRAARKAARERMKAYWANRKALEQQASPEGGARHEAAERPLKKSKKRQAARTRTAKKKTA